MPLSIRLSSKKEKAEKGKSECGKGEGNLNGGEERGRITGHIHDSPLSLHSCKGEVPPQDILSSIPILSHSHLTSLSSSNQLESLIFSHSLHSLHFV